MHPALRFFVLLIFGWALAAAAQGAPPGLTMDDMLTGSPECAQSCVMRELMASSCPLLNIDTLADCVCPDIERQSRMSMCVQQACGHAEAVAASKQSARLCAAHPPESRAGEIRTMSIIALAVGVPVTLARCLARLLKTKSLGGDDWAGILATVFLIGMAVNGFFLSKMGGGLHFWNVDPDNEVSLWVTFWISQLFYSLGQYFAKLSILLLYLRIFGCTRWMKRACYGLMAVLTTISATSFLLMFFQCVPLAAIWDKYRTDGRCIDVAHVAFAGAASSIAWDAVLIILPIPEIRKLQISPRKRLGATLVLAFASCASVTSVIRLRFIVQFNSTHDQSWDDVPIGIWSLLEQLCVVVCGSLPALRPWLIALIPNVTFQWGTTKARQDSHVAAVGHSCYPPTADSSRRPSYLSGGAAHKRRSTLSLFLGTVSPMHPFFAASGSPGDRPESQWQELPEVAPHDASARDLKKGVDMRPEVRENGPLDDESKSLALATTHDHYSWGSASCGRGLTREHTQLDEPRGPGGLSHP